MQCFTICVLSSERPFSIFCFSNHGNRSLLQPFKYVLHFFFTKSKGLPGIPRSTRVNIFIQQKSLEREGKRDKMHTKVCISIFIDTKMSFLLLFKLLLVCDMLVGGERWIFLNNANLQCLFIGHMYRYIRHLK